MLVSKAHLQNIFDKSDYDCHYDEELKVYYGSILLPNGTVLFANAEAEQYLVDKIKVKVRELEEYLERDKRFYGYDIGNEYE